jgi:hypothetical protein
MTMLKISLAIVAIVLVAVVAMQPAQSSVTRSATIAAPPPVVFVHVNEGGGTRVTWTMDGQSNFIGKAMSLAFDFDKMIGGDFEQGLAGIKSIVESGPK